MKNLKVIIIAATCFLSLNLLSQNEVKSNRIVQYGYFGLEGGYIQGIEGAYVAPSLTIGFKKGFEFSVDYKKFDISDPNRNNTIEGIPLFISVYENYGIDVGITSFNFGKSLCSTDKMRVVLSAGPSISKYDGFVKSGVNIVFLGSSTKTQTFSESVTGLDVKTKFDFTGGKVIGASLILNANFSEVQNYYSAGLAFTFGKLK